MRPNAELQFIYDIIHSSCHRTFNISHREKIQSDSNSNNNNNYNTSVILAGPSLTPLSPSGTVLWLWFYSDRQTA